MSSGESDNADIRAALRTLLERIQEIEKRLTELERAGAERIAELERQLDSAWDS